MSRLLRIRMFRGVRITRCGLAMLVLLLVQAAAFAQYLNFRGDWEGYFPDGKKSRYVWRITQTAGDLSFQDVGGTGSVFTGRTSGKTITDSNGKTGTVSADYLQIVWSDGVIWKKPIAKPTAQLFPDGSLINLIADNGARMSRCNGCQDMVAGVNFSNTVTMTRGNESQYSTFEVRNDASGKIMLRADTGNSVSYCNGCISGNVVPENMLIDNKYTPNNDFSKFELTKLSNGKYTLKAGNGKYLARCGSCSPSLRRRTGGDSDVLAAHLTDPNLVYAQWTILLPGQPNPYGDALKAPRFSYDSNPYVNDPTNPGNPYKWTGGHDRTIYNPLDGGVLLQYNFPSQGNADGCSAGVARDKARFLQPCLAHDTNYDAPFPLAGFPKYPNGNSIGQEISDYLFLRDMKQIGEDISADAFYAGVTLFGKFRGSSTGKTIFKEGGVIAVENKGLYVMRLKATWTAPDGIQRSAEVEKPINTTAVIPISVGASNIRVECTAIGGLKPIFTKTFGGPGMYAYTVYGGTLTHSFEEGLR